MIVMDFVQLNKGSQIIPPFLTTLLSVNYSVAAGMDKNPNSLNAYYPAIVNVHEF